MFGGSLLSLGNKQQAKMAESVTSSITENPDDPLLDLSDEQLSNLLEDTLWVHKLLKINWRFHKL